MMQEADIENTIIYVNNNRVINELENELENEIIVQQKCFRESIYYHKCIKIINDIIAYSSCLKILLIIMIIDFIFIFVVLIYIVVVLISMQ
jgi:hypothetical protein